MSTHWIRSLCREAGRLRMSDRMQKRGALGWVCLLVVGCLMSTFQYATAGVLGEGKPATKAPLQLSLRQAIETAIAPDGNSRAQLAREVLRQAQSRSAQARAALLPNVDAALMYQNRTLNLSALGIQINLPIPGFQIPTHVGPFNTYDTRATLSQNLLDISSIRRFQASQAGVAAGENENQSTQDQVAGLIAKLYLVASRSEADLQAARANVKLSEALLKLAADQKETGMGTGIEVTRARVQLANERQRLLVTENDRTRSHLELLRHIGLDMDQPLELMDPLRYIRHEAGALDQQLAIALRSRSDMKTQMKREESARLTHSATKLERVPSLVGFADYGTIGRRAETAIPTRTYGVSVRVPLFDGGRRDARRAETASQLRQEQIKTQDLAQQIELDVRIAFDRLRSAEEQVAVSREGLDLANQELAQARRRYEAGVASGLEITDAQTRLERSRDNEISALFNYNVAILDLGLATGTIRQMIK